MRPDAIWPRRAPPPLLVLALGVVLGERPADMLLSAVSVAVAVSRAHDALANAGLRVLGVAVRSLSHPAPGADVESSLTLVGLFGLMDSPRADVRDAIETCGRAGIRPIMITGDHPLTAQVIAGSLGIGESRERTLGVVTGSMLESVDPEALRHQVARTSVYARVSQHKTT